jgi:hypothetical protein
MAEAVWRKNTTPKIILSTGINLAGNSGLFINLKKPGGTVVQKVASVEGVEADGKISYQCTTADLDEMNQWKAVAQVEFEADAKVYKSVPQSTFTVVDDFDT